MKIQQVAHLRNCSEKVSYWMDVFGTNKRAVMCVFYLILATPSLGLTCILRRKKLGFREVNALGQSHTRKVESHISQPHLYLQSHSSQHLVESLVVCQDTGRWVKRFMLKK